MGLEIQGLLMIALKSTAIYIFIVAAIRIFGKKELAQLSVIDLVFILLISNAVQNAMVGQDTTVLGGIAAATGLFIINFIFETVIRVFYSFFRFVFNSICQFRYFRTNVSWKSIYGKFNIIT